MYTVGLLAMISGKAFLPLTAVHVPCYNSLSGRGLEHEPRAFGRSLALFLRTRLLYFLSTNA